MRDYLKQARDDLGDSLRGIEPTNARPIGQVEAGGDHADRKHAIALPIVISAMARMKISA